MLMQTRMSGFQKTLAGFLGSLLVVFGLLGLWAWFTAATESSFEAAVVTGTVLLGLAWVVLGWVFVPSVETYLGPGRAMGIPILWPGSAIPDRNTPVLDDLQQKLSGQTDMGIVFAGLGFFLIVTGVVFYGWSAAGAVLLAGFGLCLAAVLAYTFVPPEPASEQVRSKVPPNP